METHDVKTCTPLTAYSGPADCLDGDCDEYATEDGEPTGVECCSHIREEQLCEQHSTFSNDEWGYCIHAALWPCLGEPADSPAKNSTTDTKIRHPE